MNGESLDIKNDQLEKLKELFPEVITEGKVDWEKLKASLGEEVNFNNERYVLNWAGKSEAFKILQLSITDTLVPSPEESINFDTTQNIFIEGENLRVLKALQKSYYGKIKCIIIDPPYNTGSDSFIYPDKFSEKKEDYQKRVGDKDEEGYMMKEGLFHKNSKESGHYHSNWLNMMYPRLFLAKNLMRDDGVIFVHIDDNEVHNLRLLMNEIFGEENFVTTFIWEKRKNRENRKLVSMRHEYILCYSKNSNSGQGAIKPLAMTEEALARYKNPDNDPRGAWKSDPATAQAGHGTKSQFYTLIAPNGKEHSLQSGRCWLYTEDVMNEAIKDGRIWFGSEGNGVPRIKTFLNEKERTLTPESILFANEVSTNEAAKNYIKELFDGHAVFETPKPVELVELLLKLAGEGDIVLDFFAGSSATAEAVLRSGIDSKFIMVQLPELCDIGSEAYKSGYSTIAEISKERIRRVIKKLEVEKSEKKKKKASEIDFEEQNIPEKITDLGFKVFKLSPSNFKIWLSDEINEENLSSQLDAFTNPVKEGSQKENMLYELILKSGYELTSDIEYNKKNNYYSVNNNDLVIGLEKMNKDIVDEIISSKPKKVIALDNLFTGNDQLKTNTVLQMKDAGIDFKTI